MATTEISGIRCLLCNDLIWSKHRHDFRYCSCGYCFVDGGREYLRFGWGMPYPHEGTDQEKLLAKLATEKIGKPSTVRLHIDLEADRLKDWITALLRVKLTAHLERKLK